MLLPPVRFGFTPRRKEALITPQKPPTAGGTRMLISVFLSFSVLLRAGRRPPLIADTVKWCGELFKISIVLKMQIFGEMNLSKYQQAVVNPEPDLLGGHGDHILGTPQIFEILIYSI